MLAGGLRHDYGRADGDRRRNRNGRLVHAGCGDRVGAGSGWRSPHVRAEGACSRAPGEAIGCATRRSGCKRNLARSERLVRWGNRRDRDGCGRDYTGGGNNVAFGIRDRQRVRFGRG